VEACTSSPSGMMKRLTFLLVLTVVLFGCHHDPTGPEPTPTPTATAVPSGTPTATATASPSPTCPPETSIPTLTPTPTATPTPSPLPLAGTWSMGYTWAESTEAYTYWYLQEDGTFTCWQGGYGFYSVWGSVFHLEYSNGTKYTGTIGPRGRYMEGTMISYKGIPGTWWAVRLSTAGTSPSTRSRGPGAPGPAARTAAGDVR
jgi:hypothetical protein